MHRHRYPSFFCDGSHPCDRRHRTGMEGERAAPIVQSHKSCRKLVPVADSIRGPAGLAESVDAVHSKCIVERRVGSSPTSGTNSSKSQFVLRFSAQMNQRSDAQDPRTQVRGSCASVLGAQGQQASKPLRLESRPTAVRVQPRRNLRRCCRQERSRPHPHRLAHSRRCDRNHSAPHRGCRGASRRSPG